MKIVVLTILFISSQVLACDIPFSTYSAITESEYSLSIELNENGRYRFIHKNWLPGDLRHVGEEHIYKGEYECKGNRVKLKYTDIGETIEGKYHGVSLKELGLKPNKESMVLDFTETKNSKSKIAGWRFMPAEFMEGLYK